MLQYRLNNTLPDVVQLRDELNDSNPLFLAAGNAQLVPEYHHNIDFNYCRYFGGLAGSALRLFVNADITRNSIVPRSTYYTEQTYLPEYDYTAQAGSTLYGYDNVNGRWSLRTMLSGDIRFSRLKSSLNISATHAFEHSPYYYNTLRDISESHTLNASIGIRSDIVKNSVLTLQYVPNYQHSDGKQSGQTSRIMSNSIQASTRFNKLFGRGFLEVFYCFSNIHYISRSETTRGNLLNIYAGCKVTKGLDLSVTAYDILGDINTRAFTLSNNYTMQTVTDYYGRYVSLNLKWTFSKVKSNRRVDNGNYIIIRQ